MNFNLKDIFNRRVAARGAVILWLVFSAVYIGWDLWNDFKNNYLAAAFLAGKEETVNSLIKQAENEQCQPFNVFSGEKTIGLINVACLKKESASVGN